MIDADDDDRNTMLHSSSLHVRTDSASTNVTSSRIGVSIDSNRSASTSSAAAAASLSSSHRPAASSTYARMTTSHDADDNKDDATTSRAYDIDYADDDEPSIFGLDSSVHDSVTQPPPAPSRPRSRGFFAYMRNLFSYISGTRDPSYADARSSAIASAKQASADRKARRRLSRLRKNEDDGNDSDGYGDGASAKGKGDGQVRRRTDRSVTDADRDDDNHDSSDGSSSSDDVDDDDDDEEYDPIDEYNIDPPAPDPFAVSPPLSATSLTASKSAGIESSIDGSNRPEIDDNDPTVNFSTVDWSRLDEFDLLAYHQLHDPILDPSRSNDPANNTRYTRFKSKIILLSRRFLRLLRRSWRSGQGWLLCGLVGFCTGLLASVIDMAVHWVTDIRQGVCSDNIFLDNKLCCAQVGPTNNQNHQRNNDAMYQICPLWKNWDVIFNEWSSTSSTTLLSGLPLVDYATTYVAYVIISMILAVTSAWLVITWSRHAAGSGIPEIKTILGGVVIRRVLGGWALLIKCVAVVLSVSSGLSVGKEGPFVHIAACVGNLMCKVFPRYRYNQAKTNEILSASCAAGVAVAFGAPIGGILYSLEEVSSYFPHKTMWRAFFCAIIASLTVQYIDPFQEGKLAQFQINYINPWGWAEMIPFALLGVMGGLVGAFFIWANSKVVGYRRRSFMARWPLCEVAIVTAISTLIRYQSSFTRGNSTNLLEALFSDCNASPGVDPLNMCEPEYTASTIGELLFSFMTFLLLTTYSIGLPVPSGLLIPSLTVGACMGRLIGTIVRYWQHLHPEYSLWIGCNGQSHTDCITPGIYALVGGAAVLGGVTRMTIALVVIMFEITGGLTYLLPIMVAVVTSKLVGDFFIDSIYHGAIHALKYPFLDVKHEIPSVLQVADAMTSVKDIIVIPIHGHTISSIQRRIKHLVALNINGCPVVTSMEEMLVVGYITRADMRDALRYALNHGGTASSGVVTSSTPCYFSLQDLPLPLPSPYLDLSSSLDPAPVQVSEGMALYRLHDMLCKLGLRYCIVARFGKVVGVITKKDVIKYLQTEEHKHDNEGGGHKKGKKHHGDEDEEEEKEQEKH